MAAEQTKRKIVIVEDEGLIAADLETRLKVAGYAVPGTADSASKALQLVGKTSPDLVLMDIRLKGNVDGIETANQIRQQHDVPVVYLTAYEDAVTLERAGRTQAFGYIRKPIASAGLKGAIEMAIAKHRYERELREQRDWAIASFASVPQAVLVTDRQGRVTYLNARAEDLTGSTSDQALGLSCWELLRLYHRESGDALQDLLPVAMLNGEPVPLPSGVGIHKDAQHTYAVEGSVAPRWRDGRMDGTVVTLSDVTRSAFEQEQARQDGKQEALERLADGMVRQLRESAQTAGDSSHMIANSPPDVFEITSRLRVALEAPDVHLERVDVRQLLQNLEIAWKRIEHQVHFALHQQAAIVQADSWQLTKTLAGVLLHAKGCMRTGGTLSIELSKAEAEPMIHSVRIRVSYQTEEDAAAIDQLFEPAWENPSQDLHVAYKAVKKMGGTMAARLEGGDCAIVDIYLSQVMAEAAGVPVPRSEEPAVLLMEGNLEIRRLLHTHFERNGQTLLAAAGCEEALLVAELYPGAIPLIIVNLPRDHEGREWLARQLAIVRPAARIRLLNGYSEPRQAAAGDALEPAPERQLSKWDLLEWAQESSAAMHANGNR